MASSFLRSVSLHNPLRMLRRRCLSYRSYQPLRRSFSSTPRNPRRRRLIRRGVFLSIGFGAWFYVIDADAFTYSLDLFHRKYNKSPLEALQPYIGGGGSGSLGMKPNSFKSKTIWIVGASSGIGEHIAYQLCQSTNDAPRRIILSARRQHELIRVANECRVINPTVEITVKPMDITSFCSSKNDGDFGEQFVGDLMDEMGGDIDIVVLNSGMIQKCRGEYASMESFKTLAEINVFGPIGLAQSMIKQWRFRGLSKSQKKRHQLAVTSSIAGKVGCPGYAFYTATKHGVNGFFEAMRVELQDENIECNLMCLGPLLPTKGTHPEMGGKEGVQFVREYTDKYGNIMTVDRSAELYTTALRYSLSESWIAVNPYLFYIYGRQYIPAVAIPMTNVFAKSFVREVQKSDRGF